MSNGLLTIRYRGVDWTPFVTRNMSFWHSCLDCGGSLKYSRNYFVIPRHFLFITTDQGRLTTAFNSELLNRSYHDSVKQLCQSKDFFKLEKVIQRKGRALLEACHRLNRSASRQNYHRFIEAYAALTPALGLMTSFGRIGEELLLKEMRRLLPKAKGAELDETLATVSCPDQYTPFSLSQISLLRIGQDIQKRNISRWKSHPTIQRRIRRYTRQYSYLPVNFNEEPWSDNNIKNMLAELLKRDCGAELKSLSSGHCQKIEQRNRQMRTLQSSRLRHLARVMQLTTELNEYRKQVFCQASLAYRPLFRQLSRRHRLPSWRTLYLFTPHEVSRLAFDNEEALLKLLPKRKIAGVMPDPGREAYYRVMPDAVVRKFVRSMGKKMDGKSSVSNNIIRGMSANPGRVIGTVKVVYKKSDFSKFRMDDILVSPMTSVDFVPIMEQAAAFVTDEGGITSHASIVARELNKPCIIGTKIATKVLKDGDKVEVDATRGVIMKIRK